MLSLCHYAELNVLSNTFGLADLVNSSTFRTVTKEIWELAAFVVGELISWAWGLLRSEIARRNPVGQKEINKPPPEYSRDFYN